MRRILTICGRQYVCLYYYLLFLPSYVPLTNLIFLTFFQILKRDFSSVLYEEWTAERRARAPTSSGPHVCIYLGCVHRR